MGQWGTSSQVWPMENTGPLVWPAIEGLSTGVRGWTLYKNPEVIQVATSAQFIVSLYHFFPSHELSPLQLFFYRVESPSFWLSKTALLASFGSDGGHWRFLKENECNQPAGEPVSYLSFLVVFLVFHHAPPCNKLGALKWSLMWFMWSQNDRRWVDPAQWSIPRG